MTYINRIMPMDASPPPKLTEAVEANSADGRGSYMCRATDAHTPTSWERILAALLSMARWGSVPGVFLTLFGIMVAMARMSAVVELHEKEDDAAKAAFRLQHDRDMDQINQRLYRVENLLFIRPVYTGPPPPPNTAP